MNDLKSAFRQLLKDPGFTAVAVVTLALGIGATTAIFSVVNAVMLRPLPYPESDRLVWLSERGVDWTGGSLSFPNFLDWQAGSRDVFQHFGVFNWNNWTLTGAGEPVQLPGALASWEVFAALKVSPQLGRAYGPDEDRAGAEPVVLISHSLWKGRFAGDAAVVGRPVALDGKPCTVIGVMPAGFAFPDAVDVWVPLRPVADPGWQDRGSHPGLQGVARLRPGVTVERAGAAVDAVAERLEHAYLETNKNRRGTVQRLIDHQVGDTSRALWTLLGAVGLVLLIACANVANLLLARAAARQKELAVRAALGAGRWRVVRQLLTESVLLAAVATAAGLLLAHWGLGLILVLAKDSIPRADEIALDGRVLLFATGLALATGIFFGLAPAWQASRPEVIGALKEGARGATAARGRLRAALTVGEVALTLLLLVGAGLLLRSFWRLQAVNPGYAYERVLCFRAGLLERTYPSFREQVGFYERLLEGLRATPGVEAASVASQLPLDGNNWDTTFLIDGEPEPPPHERPSMEVHVVGADYFRTMGIPVRLGRPFDERDNREHLRGTGREKQWAAGLNAIVIDEEFARRHFPRGAVGRRVRLTWGEGGVVMTVVGVVGRVREEKLSESGGKVQAYLPFLQVPGRGMAVVVKTALEPSALVPVARRQVAAMDPEVPLFEVRTLAEMRDAGIGPHRLNLALLLSFAGVAVVLALVGIYGVLAYGVAQRRREIGVRMALGARRRQVVGLVVGEGMRLAAVGAAVGLVGALAFTRLLQSFLYEVNPLDPLTLAMVVAAIAAVAILASLVPARRAAMLEPLAALRHE